MARIIPDYITDREPRRQWFTRILRGEHKLRKMGKTHPGAVELYLCTHVLAWPDGVIEADVGKITRWFNANPEIREDARAAMGACGLPTDWEVHRAKG